VTSRLAALRKGCCHPQLRVTIERSWSRDRLLRRATAGEVMRGSAIRGCARRSYRLQKSTSGAWPFTPRDEESLDHENGSSSSARERWMGRTSVGSRIVGGKTARSVAGSHQPEGSRERVFSGALVEERRSGSGKSPPLTWGRWKRLWFLSSTRVTPGAWGRDRERQRSIAQPCAWPTTPGRGGTPARRMPGIHQPKGAMEP
jgi:hypothetical protein